jgi:hypothetical protein
MKRTCLGFEHKLPESFGHDDDKEGGLGRQGWSSESKIGGRHMCGMIASIKSCCISNRDLAAAEQKRFMIA